MITVRQRDGPVERLANQSELILMYAIFKLRGRGRTRDARYLSGVEVCGIGRRHVVINVALAGNLQTFAHNELSSSLNVYHKSYDASEFQALIIISVLMTFAVQMRVTNGSGTSEQGFARANQGRFGQRREHSSIPKQQLSWH